MEIIKKTKRKYVVCESDSESAKKIYSKHGKFIETICDKHINEMWKNSVSYTNSNTDNSSEAFAVFHNIAQAFFINIFGRTIHRFIKPESLDEFYKEHLKIFCVRLLKSFYAYKEMRDEKLSQEQNDEEKTN